MYFYSNGVRQRPVSFSFLRLAFTGTHLSLSAGFWLKCAIVSRWCRVVLLVWLQRTESPAGCTGLTTRFSLYRKTRSQYGRYMHVHWLLTTTRALDSRHRVRRSRQNNVRRRRTAQQGRLEEWIKPIFFFFLTVSRQLASFQLLYCLPLDLTVHCCPIPVL